MKAIFKTSGIVLVMSFLLFSCKKEIDVNNLATGNYSNTSTPLKDAADFPIGAAIGFSPMTTDGEYSAIVKRDFDAVTFEYEMKHGAIVEDNGTLDFTNADALVAASNGMQIFGHTLGWHQNQNATYLKNFAGIVVPAAAELIANGGFEDGGAANFTNWANYNTGNPAGTSQITVGAGANEVRTGTRSMKVHNPIGYPGSQWRVQVASDLFNTVSGEDYIISYWVKAASAGGSIRMSTGPTAQYQGDQTIGTAWQLVTWTITANSPQTRILFDMGQAANTYYIDDVSVKEVVTPPSGGQVADKLDIALGDFITNTVNRYKTSVHEWDVVNELFTDNGNIRNNANTDITPSDVLVWSNYLGRDYAYKAFEYAKAADPTAILYINDYGLESNPAKLDSLIAYVAELKGRGAKVDGIGTQMHVSRNTSLVGIDRMFQKLAATGLKIRISELDIRTVLNSAAAGPTPQLLAYQASMMEYIVSSYMKHIPAAQRAGITVWGVVDKYSWIYDNGKEFPLLYDNEYNKKPAYGGFLNGLNQ
jgi:endo-1,4-beta-xylanase